jgi:probable blue pigment (indigoidine) exporter
LIVGEALDMRQWAGILVILLSLLLMKLPQNLRCNPLKARG